MIPNTSRCMQLSWVTLRTAMIRVLCVAEKNDAAKNIAALLANGQVQRSEGRSKFNKVYQFEHQFMGQRAFFLMTSVSGHLMQIDFDAGYREWRLGQIDPLFDAPIKRFVPERMAGIEQTIREKSRICQALVIWTDCDREGENIGAEIVAISRNENPRIEVFRARFSEITAPAVRRALANVIAMDQKVIDAVDCRSELDLRIGAAFTRLQTLHLQSTVSDFAQNNVVSYGSCQFPTLGFVVERYKAVKEFIPEPFWKLIGRHRRGDQPVEFYWNRNRLFDKPATEMFRDVCVEALNNVRVCNVRCAPKTRYRPVALETVEFEKLAVRKLRISARDAMASAERLYTQGYISYPRTETNIFPKELQLGPLVEAQSNHADWGTFASGVMQSGGPRPRNGSKTDEAHPPIHPLKTADRNTLSGLDWPVYELITRHFLACVSRDAKGQETTVEAIVADEGFTATGLVIEDRGFLEVYRYDNWNAKLLPAYIEGEQLQNFTVEMNEGRTTPPLLLNEADLIALMEKHGIGTDATHAEHIEKIKERLYVSVNADKRFTPSNLGLALVDAYDEMGFQMSKPVLRSNLESRLVDICNGRRTKAEVLAEQLRSYRNVFRHTEDNIRVLSDIVRRYAVQNQNLNQVQQNPNQAGRGGGNAGRGGGGGGGGGGAATRGRPRRGRGGGTTVTFQPTRQPTAAVPATGAPANCSCGMAPIQRTANTAANRGRQFMSCPRPRGQGCNFFQWIT